MSLTSNCCLCHRKAELIWCFRNTNPLSTFGHCSVNKHNWLYNILYSFLEIIYSNNIYNFQACASNLKRRMKRLVLINYTRSIKHNKSHCSLMYFAIISFNSIISWLVVFGEKLLIHKMLPPHFFAAHRKEWNYFVLV